MPGKHSRGLDVKHTILMMFQRFIRLACPMLLAVIVIASTAPAYGGSIIHVDGRAGVGGDGANWASAFAFLQDALAFAADPAHDVSEIRVAQGVYQPDRSSASAAGNRD